MVEGDVGREETIMIIILIIGVLTIFVEMVSTTIHLYVVVIN